MISINGTNRVKNNALWVFQDYGNRILLLSGKRVIKNSAKQSIVKSLLGFVMLVHSHCFAQFSARHQLQSIYLYQKRKHFFLSPENEFLVARTGFLLVKLVFLISLNLAYFSGFLTLRESILYAKILSFSLFTKRLQADWVVKCFSPSIDLCLTR